MAILCSGCRTIIKTGVDFTPEEWNYAKVKGSYLEPQYCNNCKKSKNDNSETESPKHL